MENDDSRWVDGRLASLDPSAAWTPDSGRALARVRARQRAFHRRIAGILFGAAAAAIAMFVLMTLSAPQACATPTSCAERFWEKVFPKRPAGPPKPAVTFGA